jgi:Baseplate J-like protein
LPLPTLILDDRSYQQLRDELVRRIPVYNGEWTDYNPSDPGITLIELFAFLGENLLYRFNQIPDATKLKFLKLLQIPLRPPTTATALVTLARADSGPGAAGSVLVPIGSELMAGAVPFESVTEVAAWPLEVTAVGRIVAPAPTSADIKDFTDASIDARGGIKPGESAAYYIAQTVPLDPATPGAVPVDFATAAKPVDFQKSVDGTIWIAVRKTATTDVNKLGKALLNIGFIPDPQIVSIDQVLPCPGQGPVGSTAQVTWEASTGIIDKGEPKYVSLIVEGDTTLGLAQQGVVRIRLPDDPTALGTYQLADLSLAGTGDFPPELDDKQQAADTLFWLRARRVDPAQPLGSVLFIGINALEAVQSRKAKPEFLGTGNAQAKQVYSLINKPVLAGSVKIQVEESDGWTDWSPVDGFEGAQEDSRVYVLDPEAGKIHFPDGIRGRAPQIGERIRALEYRYGGGPQGNVAGKAIATVTGIGQVKAVNPLPASGGAPAEKIEEGLDRIPGEFRRHDRAVTQSDFSELALATPGADLGRADCIPLFDPRTKKREAAGVVSVVVWPREDLKHPNAPMPDRNLLRRVCAWLDARRLITTELNVIPPTYRKVAVAVGLQAKPGYGIEAVRRWVELVIRQYLAPLPPYGPEGGGWPLGRHVFGPELEAAALQVEGVEFLTGLKLAVWKDDGWVAPTPASTQPCPRDEIQLEAWEVPELAEITVVQGEPLKPGDAIKPPSSPLVPVPIPTIVEKC